MGLATSLDESSEVTRQSGQASVIVETVFSVHGVVTPRGLAFVEGLTTVLGLAGKADPGPSFHVYEVFYAATTYLLSRELIGPLRDVL